MVMAQTPAFDDPPPPLPSYRREDKNKRRYFLLEEENWREVKFLEFVAYERRFGFKAKAGTTGTGGFSAGGVTGRITPVDVNPYTFRFDPKFMEFLNKRAGVGLRDLIRILTNARASIIDLVTWGELDDELWKPTVDEMEDVILTLTKHGRR